MILARGRWAVLRTQEVAVSNVGVGHEVRLAGSKGQGQTGVVVRRVAAPMPDILQTPEIERAHALNVWRGLPEQITVFWTETGRVEYLVSSEVEFAWPQATYRAGDFGFPILAVETDGYCDLIVRSATGEQIARVDWLADKPEPNWADPQVHRRHLHQAIDAYCDEMEKRDAQAARPAAGV